MSKVNLSKPVIEQIVATVMDTLEKQKKESEKTKRDRRLRNTKLLVRNYRSFKQHCAAIPDELKEMDEKLSLDDELGVEELALESIKKSKRRTMAMVKFIDKVLGVYKIICESSGKEEEVRRYQALYLLYISDDKKTAQEIATCQKTDPRTVYRDVDKACKALSALIFGVDSIRFTD